MLLRTQSKLDIIQINKSYIIHEKLNFNHYLIYSLKNKLNQRTLI
jgi:hypothetical protein